MQCLLMLNHDSIIGYRPFNFEIPSEMPRFNCDSSAGLMSNLQGVEELQLRLFPMNE